MSTDNPQENQSNKLRFWKRFGVGTIIFFIVKGTISTILILYTGKGIWVWLSKLFQ